MVPYTDKNLHKSAKIFVVGAGGIGCELLKNLVLTGFENLYVIDLDTIDVSNLNRQFLFQRQHVGQSKSICASNTVKLFNPNVNITTFHESVMSPKFNREFFKQFTVVMNALDNKAARTHVNRMCLAAGVPLVESGTGGYRGQVTLIKKGQYECYECQPKKASKSYPGCTIRNTPSEPIHCIVWSKHLFNQLFGEPDPDQDVSPDTADPEAVANAGEVAASKESETERKSTREWVQEIDYNADKILHKVFHDDIRYLLTMDKLWKSRKPPTPLDLASLKGSESNMDSNGASCYALKDQRPWSLEECVAVFRDSVRVLSERKEGFLTWDKDDSTAMDFVTASANIRASIFGIEQKSRFDVKGMAGNIITAIATTNAIIAGQIVLEGMKILREEWRRCTSTILQPNPTSRRKLIIPSPLVPPNPNCYACAEKPEVTVTLNTEMMTVGGFQERVLKKHLGMVAPDVEIDDGKGTILISSEEGETEENADKSLAIFGVTSHSRLKCDDFLQEYELVVNILHSATIGEGRGEDDGAEFVVSGSVPAPAPVPMVTAAASEEQGSSKGKYWSLIG
eukprot:sb/3463475/